VSAKAFWLILAVMAIIGIALVGYHARTNPQSIDPGVDHHAAEEIEKAKQR
jgi:hypothetical protein